MLLAQQSTKLKSFPALSDWQSPRSPHHPWCALTAEPKQHSDSLLLGRENIFCGNKCQPSYFIQGQGPIEVIKEQDSSSSSLTDNDCWQVSGRYQAGGNYQCGNTAS